FQAESGLTFRISFDVPPVIELSRLGGFEVRRPASLVRSQDVDAALASVRDEHAIWLPSDDERSPRVGDLVTVRILTVSAAGGAAAGKPEEVGLPWARRLRLRASSEHRGRYQFVIGGEDAVPALEEAIGTLLPGETRDFTLALPDESGGGVTERLLRITLEDRQVKELPELDDAFACSLGDLEGLDALREKITDDLREEAVSRAEAVLRARLLDQVVAANPFQVPTVMAERYARSLLEDGVDAGAPEIGAELLRQAEDAVKRLMVVERIAELHGLAAAPAEIDARVAEIARRGQVTTERVRDQLVRTDRMERLVGDITHAKVFDFLRGRSEILDDDPDTP
ncbi:MAG: hypothetical protein EXR95_06045, partial [Gemmatimonadetes bacterium]|nr:hypothetical protein [Gemmatimonadota bacterium]